LEYTIGPAMLDITAAPYGETRYPIEVRMDGRIFARFHLDVGIGDIAIHPLEAIETHAWLEFAGISASRVPMIARNSSSPKRFTPTHCRALLQTAA
jgi:hypothetical protein